MGLTDGFSGRRSPTKLPLPGTGSCGGRGDLTGSGKGFGGFGTVCSYSFPVLFFADVSTLKPSSSAIALYWASPDQKSDFPFEVSKFPTLSQLLIKAPPPMSSHELGGAFGVSKEAAPF